MDTEFLVQVGSHTQIRLTVWLRGVEVAVKGYVEKADRSVGIMADTLVVEELRPLTPNRLWREPDLDDLLATGEYAGIESAFFETYDKRYDADWAVVYYNQWYDEDSEGWRARVHEGWLDYWFLTPIERLAQAIEGSPGITLYEMLVPEQCMLVSIGEGIYHIRVESGAGDHR